MAAGRCVARRLACALRRRARQPQPVVLRHRRRVAGQLRGIRAVGSTATDPRLAWTNRFDGASRQPEPGPSREAHRQVAAARFEREAVRIPAGRNQPANLPRGRVDHGDGVDSSAGHVQRRAVGRDLQRGGRDAAHGLRERLDRESSAPPGRAPYRSPRYCRCCRWPHTAAAAVRPAPARWDAARRRVVCVAFPVSRSMRVTAPVEATPRPSTTTRSAGFCMGEAKSSSGLGGRPPRLLTQATAPLRSMAAAKGAMPVSICRSTSPLAGVDHRQLVLPHQRHRDISAAVAHRLRPKPKAHRAESARALAPAAASCPRAPPKHRPITTALPCRESDWPTIASPVTGSATID